MKAKIFLFVALCLFGMFGLPYFIIQPSFTAWICTDILESNVTSSDSLAGNATLGSLAVGIGSYLALLVKFTYKKPPTAWVVIVGFIYIPLLFALVISSVEPLLVPDL